MITEARAGLVAAYNSQYGEGAINKAHLLVPTSKQVREYTRHHGLLGHFWIDLEASPSIVIVDTVDLKDFKYAWIGTRQRRSLRLVLSAGNQPITPDPERTLRVHAYTKSQERLEGVELKVWYQRSHIKNVPYVDGLYPICRPLSAVAP
ncbi:MAG: hypothetical protein G01um10147_190 [Microgenomates group bacterium Gr01-1014_7]|nr:MAG: hypothetical protein G01um10147_190 [Microgenomates group bacterium Gr01-1014_7]